MIESNFELKKEDDIPSFVKTEQKEGVMLYKFDHVVIAIDTTGKNQKELPELLFGTFENEPSKNSMNQPEAKLEGIDMGYIARCMKEMIRDSGIKKFWIYPNGEDDPENKERREQARIRLFRRFGNITQAESGYGYVLET